MLFIVQTMINETTANVRDLSALVRARQLSRHGEGRTAREALNLTIVEVAGAIGVHPLTVLRWEAAHSKPSTANALAWLAALELAGNATDDTRHRAAS